MHPQATFADMLCSFSFIRYGIAAFVDSPPLYCILHSPPLRAMAALANSATPRFDPSGQIQHIGKSDLKRKGKKPLGRGGFADVWLYEWMSCDLEVAVKILRLECSTLTPKEVQMINKEIAFMHNLSDDHIIRLKGVSLFEHTRGQRDSTKHTHTHLFFLSDRNCHVLSRSAFLIQRMKMTTMLCGWCSSICRTAASTSIYATSASSPLVLIPLAQRLFQLERCKSLGPSGTLCCHGRCASAGWNNVRVVSSTSTRDALQLFIAISRVSMSCWTRS